MNQCFCRSGHKLLAKVNAVATGAWAFYPYNGGATLCSIRFSRIPLPTSLLLMYLMIKPHWILTFID